MEQELTLQLPEYLLKHIRRRARECGCSSSFMIRRILIESFQREGLNVFREKADKRSAAYRKTREAYARNPLQINGDKRRKAYRRKNPDMEEIGDEKPKKRGRPPKEKPDVAPELLPPVLTTARIKMTGGGCSPHAHVYTQGGN